MTDRFARVPIRASMMRDLGARDLRVLIALSSHADADGRAFPSLTRIAALAAVDRAKVPAAIRNLTVAGLLRSSRRRDECGDWSSTLYQIVFDPAEVVPLVVTPGAPGGTRGVPTEGTTVVPLVVTGGGAPGGNLTDHSFNRPSNTDDRRPLREPPSEIVEGNTASQFERFWQAYPSRGGQANPRKPAVEKFAAAVKRGIAPELMIRAAANYAEAMRRSGTAGRYIKTAEVWLSKASWEQYGTSEDPEPLRAGMI